MTQTGWIHIGILLLVFAGAVGFVLRRMVLPSPKDGAQSETIAGASGGYAGGLVDGGGH